MRASSGGRAVGRGRRRRRVAARAVRLLRIPIPTSASPADAAVGERPLESGERDAHRPAGHEDG